MAFEKDFDSILQEILADTLNQFPGADVSQGSPAFMLAVRCASATWGLYKHQSGIAKQISPDSADSLQLDRHAYCAGLVRLAGETDAQLAARVLEKRRKPVAGGNKDDYETWAGEVDGVAGALTVPTPVGAGSAHVLVWTAEENPVPGAPLLAAVTAYIEARRPVTAGDWQALPPTLIAQPIELTVTGSGNSEALSAAIRAYCATLGCGEALYLSKLVQLGLDAGYDDAVVDAPVANVTATAYQIIRAGEITITVNA